MEKFINRNGKLAVEKRGQYASTTWVDCSG